jgi:PAS domain S-box-containing protein
MNEGALLISAAGTIVYSNARFAAMVRAPLERVMGARIADFLPEHWQGTLEAVLRGGQASSHAEAEVLTAAGDRVRVYLSSAEGWDDQERLVCLIVTDLGAQRRSQEAVAAERLAGLIVEQAAEGVVVCDVSGRVVRASRAAELIVGESPLLRPFDQAFPLVRPDDSLPYAAQILKTALNGETLTGVETLVRAKDVEERTLLLSAGPILSSEGECLGCVVSFVDITERKRVTEERTLLLDQATIARAQAESASRAKDEFLAMLGHELRNPLAPILTALQLMRRRGDTASEHALIERQVKHLVTLVDDLLDVSRITRGRVELNRRVIEVSTAVTRALEQAAPLIEGRGHQLHVEIEPNLLVDADETRLAQVFSNLLTNAAKYTDRGGHIWVTVFRREANVLVTVRDTGNGLPADMLPHVFDLFVQGKRTLDRSEGGLGLGLAIVRSLVALHGGSVAARSEGVGKGSEFEVRLPLSNSPLVATARDRGSARPEPQREQSHSSRRVLVVDDNVDAAEVLAEALDDLGYATSVAYDGPSALEAAAEFTPDVALLDIGLPIMDGFELARRMREERRASPELRLIALTGYGQRTDRERSAAAGFDRHLIKPVDIDALDRAIHELTS